MSWCWGVEALSAASCVAGSTLIENTKKLFVTFRSLHVRFGVGLNQGRRADTCG